MITYSKLGSFGRLGNQLWQISSTIGIALKNEQDFTFPYWSYSDYFVNKLPQGNVGTYNQIVESQTHYKEYKLNKNQNYDLSGYFQSIKYFEDYSDLVKSLFLFNFQQAIDYVDFVSLHIRRTDYLNCANLIKLNSDYYTKAMDYFAGENFAVFSDDIEWCKTVDWLPHDRCLFVEPSEDIIDLGNMSNCKAHIIANSSFSFWAAYLSGKDTVAPSRTEVGEVANERLLNTWEVIEVNEN